MMKFKLCLLFLGLLLSSMVFADNDHIALLTTSTIGQTVTYSASVKILLFMAMLTVLPALLMTMTSFARIVIVFSILRQAIGIPNVPSNQILIGLALIMTFYVMTPVLTTINETSLEPYLNGKVSETVALEKAGDTARMFMVKQTRKADLAMFAKLAKSKITNQTNYPFHIIFPAFITSELKTAFQIGFLIFLPFLIIDLVTASVLMSMGMMMLSPMIISLPFKILFFVMLNGWSLVITSLIKSFR